MEVVGSRLGLLQVKYLSEFGGRWGINVDALASENHLRIVYPLI